MALEKKIEAILFYKGEPESRKGLAQLLKVTEDEVEKAVTTLAASLDVRGVRLLRLEDQYELVTAPEASDVIVEVKKEELVRDLGKAGAETLAIVLYRGPVSRAVIEYIRGVNCSFVLRNLQMRGLIVRVQNKKDQRSYLYQVTPELLKHLGVTAITDLPEYEQFRAELNALEATINDREEIDAREGEGVSKTA